MAETMFPTRSHTTSLCKEEVKLLSFMAEDLSQNKIRKPELHHLIIFHVRPFEGKILIKISWNTMI